MQTLVAPEAARMVADLAHPHRDTSAALLLAMKAHAHDTLPKRRFRPSAAVMLAHHDDEEGDRRLDTEVAPLSSWP